MSKKDELLNSIFHKAYTDMLIYGAGYIRFKDDKIEVISPKQFEEEMIAIVSIMVKGAE
jgi:hypothetical protein